RLQSLPMSHPRSRPGHTSNTTSHTSKTSKTSKELSRSAKVHGKRLKGKGGHRNRAGSLNGKAAPADRWHVNVHRLTLGRLVPVLVATVLLDRRACAAELSATVLAWSHSESGGVY
ncbi:hypothetical protein KIPB_017175, partial [Kipferlia bialata]